MGKLSNAEGKLKMTEVAKGNIPRNCINSDDVFIFDIGNEVFVWIGKNADKSEKKNGMRYASKYLKKYNRPAFLPVSQILEGGENKVFEASFDGKGSSTVNENGDGTPAPVGNSCCLIL